MYTNSIYTTESLKKMNSQRINRIHEQIFGFGAFNPFDITADERYEMFLAINQWMGEQVGKMVEALTGVFENAIAGVMEFIVGFTRKVAEQLKNMVQVESKRVVKDDIVKVVTDLLEQGFTCAAIGNMGLGISAKQASRIKRGRRYSNVSGIEEKKPVARQYSMDLAIFA